MANAASYNSLYVDTTGTIFSNPGEMHRAWVNVDTATAGKIILRDGGASGTIVIELRNDNDITQEFIFDPPLLFKTDIHATVSGTGFNATFIVMRSKVA